MVIPSAWLNYILVKGLHPLGQWSTMEVFGWVQDGTNMKLEEPPLAMAIRVLRVMRQCNAPFIHKIWSHPINMDGCYMCNMESYLLIKQH